MSLLTDFTFKDSGITVKIRKVSPYLWADIDAAIPMPAAPEQEVDYGEPRGRVMEKNLSDPAYQAALAARAVEVSQAWRKGLIKWGVVLEDDTWKDEVAEYRAFILSTTGKELEEKDDLLIYVLRICIGTPEDQEDLIQAITRRSQPTEEVVDQAKSSFRGSV